MNHTMGGLSVHDNGAQCQPLIHSLGPTCPSKLFPQAVPGAASQEASLESILQRHDSPAAVTVMIASCSNMPHTEQTCDAVIIQLPCGSR